MEEHQMLVRNKRTFYILGKFAILTSLLGFIVFSYEPETTEAAQTCKDRCAFSNGSIKCGKGQTASCGCDSTGNFSGSCFFSWENTERRRGFCGVSVANSDNTLKPDVNSQYKLNLSADKTQLNNLTKFTAALEKVGPTGIELAETMRLAGTAARANDAAAYISATQKTNIIVQKGDLQVQRVISDYVTNKNDAKNDVKIDGKSKKKETPLATVWELGTLGSGKKYPTQVTIKNISCKGSHTFSAATENLSWITIEGAEKVENIKIGESRSVNAVIDLINVTPGEYEGKILIRCLTCPANCVQDVSQINVHVIVK
jgi:hypothetical protein